MLFERGTPATHNSHILYNTVCGSALCNTVCSKRRFFYTSQHSISSSGCCISLLSGMLGGTCIWCWMHTRWAWPRPVLWHLDWADSKQPQVPQTLKKKPNLSFSKTPPPTIYSHWLVQERPHLLFLLENSMTIALVSKFWMYTQATPKEFPTLEQTKSFPNPKSSFPLWLNLIKGSLLSESQTY